MLRISSFHFSYMYFFSFSFFFICAFFFILFCISGFFFYLYLIIYWYLCPNLCYHFIFTFILLPNTLQSPPSWPFHTLLPPHLYPFNVSLTHYLSLSLSLSLSLFLSLSHFLVFNNQNTFNKHTFLLFPINFITYTCILI